MAKKAIRVLPKQSWTMENPPHGVSRAECEQFIAANKHLDPSMRRIDLVGGTHKVVTARCREKLVDAARSPGNVMVNA